MKIAKWGDDLAVRLPAWMVELHGLKEGDEVQITVAKRRPAQLSQQERKDLLIGIRKYRGMLPADFKFDREEAHERG